MANPVVHFEIASKDTGKVRDFYSKLFGWSINADNPLNYGLASTKEGELGIDGGLYQAEDSNDRPGVRLYAQVDDAQAFLEKAASLGGTVVRRGPGGARPGHQSGSVPRSRGQCVRRRPTVARLGHQRGERHPIELPMRKSVLDSGNVS